MARRPEELRPRSRTIMWCVPRTVSTAITKCLSAIEGNQIWFEPFHFCELFAIEWDRNLDMKLPLDYIGNEDAYQTILDALAKVSPVHYKQEYISFASVKRLLDKAVSSSSHHVFVKDIAFKFDEYSSCLPEGYKHTFLIRHPLRAIYSYRKALYKQFLERGLKGSGAEEETFDIERDNPEFSCFMENQYALWKYIRENVDSHPIVMDSDEFLANPSEMLPKYCRAVGLPYAESLLTWDASGDVVKSWRVPADDLFEHTPNFFDTAIRSCKFFPASEMISRDHVTPDVIRYTDRNLKYYEEMYESRIRLTRDGGKTV